MELPKSYDPKETEEKIYGFWEKSGFFNPDNLENNPKKTYSIAVPPPNVTGELHMGHALNMTIQDILIRKKRLQGFKTLWLPGTDHAGIATQNAVEKLLKKEGKTRFDLGRKKFIERIWEWKEKYGNIILGQFKKLGASMDWSRIRFTMDEPYSRAVKEAFLHYQEKGWIYQGERVVSWCPRCQTSLSDLELEYEEEKGKLWHIKYPIKGGEGKYITVATTRPETMLGDAAVAVNPKDERYKALVGKKAVLPLVGKEIPVIADRMIDPEFGTGALKVTPAHSLIDYEIGLQHGLEITKVIDEKGRMSENAPLPYRGLKTLEAREKIVKDLEDQNLLAKTEDYSHQVPKCYRCSTTVEAIPSKQWFLKMDELAKIASEAVKKGKIKFTPKKWEKVYFEWLKNVKDWCISRQLWWGHKIPIEGETDVLDTWFSSALWPFATLGWPDKKEDLNSFYPTCDLSTDKGIINLWVARMIFSGLEFTGKIPFSRVYIHPTVMTKEGKRMSKSLGTGINPLGLIEKYGADAVRFGISYQVTELQEMKFSEDSIVMGRKFCNKIWNASRFCLLQLGSEEIILPKKIKEGGLTNPEKKILKSLSKTASLLDENIENFRFGKASHEAYDFFWHDFCDIFIEQAKKQLSESENESQKKKTKLILLYSLLGSLKILHPFVPFITEEIYQSLPIKNKKKALLVEEWPE